MKQNKKQILTAVTAVCTLLTSVLPQNLISFGCSCAAAGPSEALNHKFGDVDLDDTVSAEDAQLVLSEYVNSIAGIECSLTEEQFLLADVNADKALTSEDAQFILLYYVANTVSKIDMTWDQIIHPESQTTVLDPELGIDYTRPTGETALRLGSEGSEVGWLQTALNQANHASIVVDCSFGEMTADAVRMFQSRCDLAADGIAGKQTITALVDILSGRKSMPFRGVSVTKDGIDLKDYPLSSYLVDGNFYLQASSNVQNGCYVIDPEKMELLRTVDLGVTATNKNVENLMGVFSDGTVIGGCYDSDELSLYEPDQSTPKKLDLGEPNNFNITVDPVGERLYWVKNDNMIYSLDRNGSRTIIPLNEDIFHVISIYPEQNVIRAEVYNEQEPDGISLALYTLDTSEKIVDLYDIETYTAGFTKDKYFEYCNSWDGSTTDIYIYDLAAKTYEKHYFFQTDTVIWAYGSRFDNKLVLAEYLSNLRDVKLLDAETGELSAFGSDMIVNECYNVDVCQISDDSWLFVSGMYDSVGDYTIIRKANADTLRYIETMQADTQPPKTDEPVIYTCGADYQAVKEKADKIGEEFGVTVLVGDAVLNAEKDAGYTFVSTEDSDYYTPDMILNSLDDLHHRLSEYPDGFFEHFKSGNRNIGLRIAIVETLENAPGSEFQAGGVAYRSGLWFNIAIREDMLDHSFHHEVWHNVESLIGSRSVFDDSEWGQFNQEGFEYLNSTEDYARGDWYEKFYTLDLALCDEDMIRYDDVYFARDYSIMTSYEDRATLIESLFSYNYVWDKDTDKLTQIQKFPHLKAKLDYLAELSKQEFGYVYWECMLDAMQEKAADTETDDAEMMDTEIVDAETEDAEMTDEEAA